MAGIHLHEIDTQILKDPYPQVIQICGSWYPQVFPRIYLWVPAIDPDSCPALVIKY